MGENRTDLILHFQLVETVEPLVSDVLHVAHNVVELPAQARLELLQLRRLALKIQRNMGGKYEETEKSATLTSSSLICKLSLLLVSLSPSGDFLQQFKLRLATFFFISLGALKSF